MYPSPQMYRIQRKDLQGHTCYVLEYSAPDAWQRYQAQHGPAKRQHHRVRCTHPRR